MSEWTAESEELFNHLADRGDYLPSREHNCICDARDELKRRGDKKNDMGVALKKLIVSIELVSELVSKQPEEIKRIFVEACGKSKGACFCGVHYSVTDQTK